MRKTRDRVHVHGGSPRRLRLTRCCSSTFEQQWIDEASGRTHGKLLCGHKDAIKTAVSFALTTSTTCLIVNDFDALSRRKGHHCDDDDKDR
jgi:hypothetical protein